MTQVTLWQQRRRGNNKEILENKNILSLAKDSENPSEFLWFFFSGEQPSPGGSSTWFILFLYLGTVCVEQDWAVQGEQTQSEGLTSPQRWLPPPVLGSRWTGIEGHINEYEISVTKPSV